MRCNRGLLRRQRLGWIREQVLGGARRSVSCSEALESLQYMDKAMTACGMDWSELDEGVELVMALDVAKALAARCMIRVVFDDHADSGEGSGRTY